jgi:hypothetical protein
MFIEHRKSDRRAAARKPAEVDTALADSKRLIAEIDVLLEHSHDLMDKQALLHRSWRN